MCIGGIVKYQQAPLPMVTETAPVGMQQAIELLVEIASGQAQTESPEVQIGRQTVY